MRECEPAVVIPVGPTCKLQGHRCLLPYGPSGASLGVGVHDPVEAHAPGWVAHRAVISLAPPEISIS
jgi:hypothetical protein